MPSIRSRESNNRVERLHGTEKERIKVMRGFDKNEGCEDLMHGFRVHYNAVRDRQALGVTPAEAAGLAPLGAVQVAGDTSAGPTLTLGGYVDTHSPVPPRLIIVLSLTHRPFYIGDRSTCTLMA